MQQCTRIVIAGLLLLAPVPAAAQRPIPDTTTVRDTTPVRLTPLRVIGSILTSSAGPSVRSGIPARAVTISGTELEKWRPFMVGEALTRRPGATLYDDLGSPFRRTIVMRGFAASPVVGLPQGVSVFVDGMPMNEPGAGEVSFDLLPLEFTNSIEVLSGTASLLGPSSLGGAVNLRTTSGADDDAAYLELAAGSYETWSAEAAIGGSMAGLDLFGGAVHQRSGGWRDDMRGERTLALISGGSAADTRGVRLVLFGALSRAETAGSLPLSVIRVRPDSNLTAGDFERLRQLNLGASAWTALGAGVASVRLYARTGDAERFNVNQAADPDVRSFTDSRTLGADADWSLTAGIAELRVGGGGLLNHTAIELHAERIDPGITTDVASDIRRGNLYALGAVHVGPATISAGARWDVIRVPFRNRLRPERDTVNTFTQLSPSAGVRVAAAANLSFHASAGRSFRPPALIEIACADPNEPCPLPFALGDDPPIDPVRVTTFEAGAAWTLRALALQLSAYRSEVYDDIFLFPYDDENEPAGSTIDGYFDNIPHTRREGIEASTRIVLPGGHRAFATYAFTRATFRTGGVEIFSIREAGGAENEVHVGSVFPLVPDHTLSIGADVVLPRGFAAGVFLHHVGRRYLRGDEANDEPALRSHTTLDLRFGWKLHRWSVDAIVRNATDEHYFAFGTFNINQGGGGVLERFVTPGAPRRIEIALRRDF